MYWHIEAKRLLRAEMARYGVSVEELADRLTRSGSFESPKSLAVKISRGKFQLSFFLQCLSVLNVDALTINLPRRNANASKEVVEETL